MIDTRITTFLTLCKTMNYTQTAKILNMTQPAVTQQIHFLEQKYNCKLFKYSGKSLSKTEKGKLLENFSLEMLKNSNVIDDKMQIKNPASRILKIGATKTIGDYVIADTIEKYLSDSNKNLSLTVDNTDFLLKQIDSGTLDFAVIEGIFDKNKYSHILFRKEEFVGICANNHPFASCEVELSDILNETVILREKGSGTRAIFEQILHQYSYSEDSFKKIISISNFSVIKHLASKGIGISFVFNAVRKNNKDVSVFTIKGMKILREFNVAYLKNSMLLPEINDFISKDLR